MKLRELKTYGRQVMHIWARSSRSKRYQAVYSGSAYGGLEEIEDDEASAR